MSILLDRYALSRRRALSPRQRESLEWVADGKTTQDVALLMGVSAAMVEKHLRLAREALPDLIVLNVRLPDLPPGDTEIFKLAVVGQGQHPQGIAIARDLKHAGGGADAALEAMADHPAPGAHGAFLKNRICRPDRRQHIAFFHMQSADIVQPAIVALHHHRVDRARLPADLGISRHHIAAQGREGRAGGQRVGQDDGRLQLAQLPGLHQAHGFAKTVDDIKPQGQLFLKTVAAVGQDGGHACLYRPFRQCHVPDPQAGHIRDQVQRPLLHVPDADIQ